MITILFALALSGTPPAKPLAPVTVKASDLEVLNKPQGARQAIWKGKVVARRSEATLRCDRMVAFLTPDDRVEQATCDGHVEAVKEENWVAGDHAEFDNVTGIITVTGNPRGKQGPNEVRGDRIIFNVDTNEVRVEKSTTVMPQGEKAVERKTGK
jgi:lipopolysaccharide transport protein LptA